MGTLFLVATPIGNLEDISARALRILGSVNLVAAEDTRQTRKLLTHFDLHVPLISYYERNKITRLEHILTVLETGDVALVSDAGTPAINDPGYELVCAALERGVNVCPIPGPCAAITALAASGLPSENFLYLGYLPRKSGERRQALEEIAALTYTLIYLETPHRLLEALRDLEAVLGNRRIAIGRELTKIHEEIFRGTLAEAREYFQEKEPRGEFTLVVSGAVHTRTQWSQAEILSALQQRRDAGEPLAQISANLAEISGWKKRDIYRLGLDVNEEEAG